MTLSIKQAVKVADRLFALMVYYWLPGRKLSPSLLLLLGFILEEADALSYFHCTASFCSGHSIDKQPAGKSTLSFNLSVMLTYNS